MTQSPTEMLNFSRADLQKLRDARRALHDLIPVLDAAGKCGMDCEAFKATRDAQDNFLEMVEKEFMVGLAAEMPIEESSG